MSSRAALAESCLSLTDRNNRNNRFPPQILWCVTSPKIVFFVPSSWTTREKTCYTNMTVTHLRCWWQRATMLLWNYHKVLFFLDSHKLESVDAHVCKIHLKELNPHTEHVVNKCLELWNAMKQNKPRCKCVCKCFLPVYTFLKINFSGTLCLLELAHLSLSNCSKQYGGYPGEVEHFTCF